MKKSEQMKQEIEDAEYVIDQVREMASDIHASKADIRWFIDKYRGHPGYIRKLRLCHLNARDLCPIGKPLNQFKNKFKKPSIQE